MAELNNPLFEDEKEFLERKKLEYERALRGDVDHIKEQSVAVGKMALAGAGIAGGIWLLSKVFGGKKRRKVSGHPAEVDFGDNGIFSGDEHESADEFPAEYYTDGLGKRHKAKHSHKNAQASAQAFAAAETRDGNAQSSGRLGADQHDAPDPVADKYAVHSLAFEQDDPFQALPYDDSRRLPDSHGFDDDAHERQPRNGAEKPGNMMGTVLQSFLQSDTGKMLVAQAAAVVLALVTKKVSEYFPAHPADATAKNSDLAAASPDSPVSAGAPYADFVPADTLNAPTSASKSV